MHGTDIFVFICTKKIFDHYQDDDDGEDDHHKCKFILENTSEGVSIF